MGGGGEDSFIAPLGFLLGLTAVVALFLSYAKQSTIVAFILVGVVVNSFGVHIETTTLGHISEVGILILLFMAGLEVELEAFLKKWKTVTIIGVGQILCSTAFFALTSLFILPAIGAKVNSNAAIYFGLCMCFSSTILVLGYLKNSKSMGTLYGQLCLGTLVLQDAASVLGIAVLAGLATGVGSCVQANPVNCGLVDTIEACQALGSGCNVTVGNNGNSFSCINVCSALDLSTSTDSDGGVGMCTSLGSMCLFQEPGGSGVVFSILILFGKLIAACLICFILERLILSRIFEAFARSFELLYLGSLGYATGLAAIAVKAGFSGEITAFLAGVSIAQLPYKMYIETKMEPIKSLGVAIFFISLGLKLNVDQKMLESLPIGFGLALFTIVATLPLFMGLGFLARLKAHNVFMIGLLMNQISEFSLILCTLCVRAKIFDPIVLTVLTVAAVVSIIISSIGHIFIDEIYEKMKRCCCLRCIDNHYRSAVKIKKDSATKNVEKIKNQITGDEKKAPRERASSLIVNCPPGLEDDKWSFESQLKSRTMEQLKIDLAKVDKNLENAREAMARTGEEKRLHHALETAHATDIIRGMIEGYVIVNHQLLFCTLRAGRMLFWEDQHDVGHTPPISVWDISGMTILSLETEQTRASKKKGFMTKRRQSISNIWGRGSSTKVISRSSNQVTENADNILEDLGATKVDTHFSDSDSEDDAAVHPWEWTIVLGHIRRPLDTTTIKKDTMKLAIHGLKDHSDHDWQDWKDALTVVSATLNPIALRRAHIKEEILSRRKATGIMRMASIDARMELHDHRNEIICIGYNEMFPAVLALADATNKNVVVVEYDPMKINAVKKLYNEKRRTQDHGEKKGSIKGSIKRSIKGSIKRSITGSIKSKNSEEELKSIEVEEIQTKKDEKKNDSTNNETKRGVHCEYADIHDPECWEELEMDQAFMIICTMKGARHAEKAIIKWLRKHDSDTIFIAYTHNNVEAIQLYEAGANFVMQTDALAMRSTKEIFMETVANVGDCSQLVIAGQAHSSRLKKLKKEDKLKFMYETG